MDSSINYSYDAYFHIFKVPHWRAYFYKFLSVNLWGSIPSTIQKRLSAFYANMYNKPFSKFIIRPYVQVNYRNKNYLEKFKPPFGKPDFDSFQDFFVREFKTLPITKNTEVWPCEGLLCDMGNVGEFKDVCVKSDRRNIHTIFGVSQGTIPPGYSFSNVFLHNKNYHRIHAPISGKITRVQHVPGDLIVLRPWIYKQNPSLPAFRNERYNIDILDTDNKTWYLSIIGGPAVGTIALQDGIAVGASVKKLQQLAMFYLGSTCCIAGPRSPRYHTKNTFVEVGMCY
ncbi:phosphatidylserine decarboxylase [Maribacter aestuarii]|uniref:phosphatidylserine decarboxylase n=1 Tax=Maribacter aestuarii TaxID=1130723 RepID=UPI00248CEAD4|nr:phosphatidylserine decarboxylase [Maribacter aestuarii]